MCVPLSLSLFHELFSDFSRAFGDAISGTFSFSWDLSGTFSRTSGETIVHIAILVHLGREIETKPIPFPACVACVCVCKCVFVCVCLCVCVC